MVNTAWERICGIHRDTVVGQYLRNWSITGCIPNRVPTGHCASEEKPRSCSR
jgi:hypothetical protein